MLVNGEQVLNSIIVDIIPSAKPPSGYTMLTTRQSCPRRPHQTDGSTLCACVLPPKNRYSLRAEFLGSCHCNG